MNKSTNKTNVKFVKKDKYKTSINFRNWQQINPKFSIWNTTKSITHHISMQEHTHTLSLTKESLTTYLSPIMNSFYLLHMLSNIMTSIDTSEKSQPHRNKLTMLKTNSRELSRKDNLQWSLDLIRCIDHRSRHLNYAILCDGGYLLVISGSLSWLIIIQLCSRWPYN